MASNLLTEANDSGVGSSRRRLFLDYYNLRRSHQGCRGITPPEHALRLSRFL